MSRSEAAIDAVVLVLSLVGLWFVAPNILVALSGDFDVGDERTFGVVMTCVAGLSSVGLVRLVLKRRRQPWGSVGVGSHDIAFAGPMAMLAVGGAFAILVAYSLMLMRTGSGAMQENAERIGEMLPAMPTWSILLVMLTVGVYEEIIFRGFLLTRIQRATNSPVAGVIISSVLFALPHATDQEWVVLPALFLIAVFWSVLVLWRGSIIPVVIGHAVFNSVQLWFVQNMQ